MKILFWLYLVTVGPLTAFGATGDSANEVMTWLSMGLWFVTLVGFYGLTYGKRIASDRFWKFVLAGSLIEFAYGAWLFVEISPGVLANSPNLEALSSGAKILVWAVVAAIALPILIWVMFLPTIALFFYAFRRPQIWHGSDVSRAA
jgi:hypothetical protein